MLKQVGNQDVKVTPEMINFAMTFSMGTLIFSTLLGIIGMSIIKGRPILAGSLLIVAVSRYIQYEFNCRRAMDCCSNNAIC